MAERARESEVVRRARPLLGTLVDIRVEGLPAADALRAIEAAFAEIAQIHQLMSFHSQDSDLARLHRAGAGVRVCVDARTREALACALRVADASSGVFDPTIAAAQVAGGYLPPPHTTRLPDSMASWRDIEIDGDAVCLHRPLWIDLGGIAKGYAVDRAVAILLAAGARQLVVNAGGDLRVAGARAERVCVRDADGRVAAEVALADGAIASSTSARAGEVAIHADGVSRHAVRGGATVSVVAPTCMIADALTKVVLARGARADGVLKSFGAQARVHDLLPAAAA